MKTILHAAWVVPMDGPMLRDAAVLIDGQRIARVGSARELNAVTSTDRIIDLGQSVLLPGLINAHTHLELSQSVRAAAPASFGQWLMDIISQRAAGDPVQAAAEGATVGRDESLRFGVSTVGDITRFASATRVVLCDGPLRVVSFGEIQAMGTRRGLLEQRLEVAADHQFASPWLRIGLSPHAPYTVEPAGYARALRLAQERDMPLTTHLAESLEEWTFLARGEGEFRALWNWLGAWDEQVPRQPDGPIHLAHRLGLLSEARVLLAHVNYASDDELNLLAEGSASVVWCPRTHAYFGHSPHRFVEMLGRGINVCVGTDSCASSPDLNILDDLRLIHADYPQLSSETLFSMLTWRAARALGMGHMIGTITPGHRADLVAFPISSSTGDPLLELLETQGSAASLWIDGQPVVQHGKRIDSDDGGHD